MSLSTEPISFGAHRSETGMSTASRKDLPSGKLQKLINRLSEILGSSGIDAEHVSATQLCDIMTAYESKSEDWMPYVSEWPNADQPYTRNLVDSGNGKYNLVSPCKLVFAKSNRSDQLQLILVWKPDSGSRIHDHTEHCCMKILQGELTETLFGWPDEDLIKRGYSCPMAQRRVTLMEKDQVAYISSRLNSLVCVKFC
jgi:cysteine dioxygenase